MKTESPEINNNSKETDLNVSDKEKTIEKKDDKMETEQNYTEIIKNTVNMLGHGVSLKDVEEMYPNISMIMFEHCSDTRDLKRFYEQFKEESEIKIAFCEKLGSLSMLEINKAKTFEEAKGAYEIMPHESNNRELAIIKWIEVCTNATEILSLKETVKYFSGDSADKFAEKLYEIFLPKIENSKTVEGVKYKLDTLSEAAYFSSIYKLALLKWENLCLKEIENITTTLDARLAFYRWDQKSYDKNFHGSKMKDAALKKWNELSAIDINEAKTLEEIKFTYENASQEMQMQDSMIKKWHKLLSDEIEKAKTLEDVRVIYDEFKLESEKSSGKNEKYYGLQGFVEKAWDNFFQKELKDMVTIEDIGSAYLDVRYEIGADALFRKGLKLCKTADDAEKLYHYVISGKNSSHKSSIYITWKELCSTPQDLISWSCKKSEMEKIDSDYWKNIGF